MSNAKFTWLLFSVYFGGRGVLASLFDAAVFARFKLQYLVSGPDFQKYCTVALLPWSLKPLFGLLSDNVPVCRRHKRPYIITVGVLAGACAAALAAMGTTLAIRTAVFCVFAVSLQLAVTDLLTESEYAKVIVNNPQLSATVVSRVWMFIFIGQIVGATTSGTLVTTDVDMLFWLTVPLSVQIMIPALCGWYDDVHHGAHTYDHELGRVALAIAVAACLLGVTTVFSTWPVQITVCAVSTLGLTWLTLRHLPRVTARCNMFMFIMCITNVQIPGALDYWYTADDTCVPGGVGFSMRFFLLVTGVIGAAAGACAVAVFRYSRVKDWQFRTMFCTAIVLRCTAALIDVAMINRWNLKVGIPDKVFFVFGKAVVQPAVAMLEQAPAVMLTSKLCTEKNESTIYAILAGYQNYGSAVAVVVGSVMAETFQVHLSPTLCTYAYLPHLVTVANVIVPMVCVPLAFMLLPHGNSDTPGEQFR